MGPLAGLRVIELVGQGPGPYCGMLLADYGCDVVAVHRPEVVESTDTSRPATNLFMRGKRSIGLNLKSPTDIAALLSALDEADVFIDPFRPGVCERLGLGPEVVCARNPRLIYGRVTGYGQSGPLAQAAGHDINYIALSGALWLLGREGHKPTAPINLLGDFAGGALMLALGIASAAFERERSGLGQVIDCAMVDGAALVAAPFFPATSSGFWGQRGTNHIDSGAHFYEVYVCADGEFVSVGAIEPQFYQALLVGLGLDLASTPQWDRSRWNELKIVFANVFKQRTRSQWDSVFEGVDACYAPVLSPAQAAEHDHNVHRETFAAGDGIVVPNPAPRFSRTPARAGRASHPGIHTELLRNGNIWSAQ